MMLDNILSIHSIEPTKIYIVLSVLNTAFFMNWWPSKLQILHFKRDGVVDFWNDLRGDEMSTCMSL